MVAGRHDLNSYERRVKRLAARYGCNVMKSQKPFGKIAEHGGYMLRDDDTREIVFGNAGYDFSATLEDVEAFLLAQPKYGAAKD